MPIPLYVLGHRNPDTDSICSAVGYADLLHHQGQAEAVAARQGPLRRETAYTLDRFGIAPPVLVTDVRPRVADVMTSPAVTMRQDASLHDVGETVQSRGVRAVPVVDGDNRLVGVTGIEDFAKAFIGGLDLGLDDGMPLNLENVVRTLHGRVLVDAEKPVRGHAMVGAMAIDSMLNRLEPGILLVIGDREDAQRAAIEFGVGALVVTGDHPVTDSVLELAREREVSVIVTGHHTFDTVRRIHLSTAICNVMRTEVPTCSPDDTVDDVRDRLREGNLRSLVVVNEDRTVLGLISRSNLLRQVRRPIVLVDHNEADQAAEGIDEAEIVGVIDHHRVANFQTRTPLFMRMEPVGSTCTLVAKLFAEANIVPSPSIAGVLLSGILADTLLFRGPTTTEEDRRIAARLGNEAKLDIQELGTSILTLASDVSNRSADELLRADFKEFRVDDSHFGIGVLETTNAADVLNRRAEILSAMKQLKETGYTSVLFAIIDILNECTTIPVVGYPEAVATAFGAELVDGQVIELPGILSRKKNIVPTLGGISRTIAAG